MKLKCDLIIQNLNATSYQQHTQDKLHKSAIIGLYRPKEEICSNDTPSYAIIMTIETKALNLKYKLNRIETYTKFINEGKASIKLLDENVYLLISGTTSLTLTNFISFLNVKMAKSVAREQAPARVHQLSALNKKEEKENATYVNKLLNRGELTSCGNNKLKFISPLCEKDINEALKMRQSRAAASAQSAQSSPISAKRLSRSSSQYSFANDNNRKAESKLQRSASVANLIVELTVEQKSVLSAIKQGKNVFFTGSAGCGKSFLLRLARRGLPSDSCFVTASTGVAASLIDGITLHAFAGMNETLADEEHTERLLQRVLNSSERLNSWRKCKHLIIDEISMVDAELFDALELLARYVVYIWLL
jgi:ATP-dependent DNA helicase PIF1